MLISFDGTNDNDIVPAGGFTLYDFCTNKDNENGWFFRVGTIVYVKQVSAPGSGTVYVSAFYGMGE